MLLARGGHFHGFHSYGGGYGSSDPHPWITLSIVAVVIAILAFARKSTE
ncbi:MAG TPA: hypothetical protein VMF08_23420 [Candidatus Sulfotelmatobacter sp.]|nr:hypothetical protein [Candidatus Sulfotelmatobacter sp.]